MNLPDFVIFTLCAISLIALIVIINQKHVKKRKRIQYLEGLNWLKTLRILLAAIQQHRGLTMGHINGDASLSSKISVIKQNINRQITQIDNSPTWIANNQIWPGITDHWHRVSSNYLTYKSQYNFSQHCNLITNLLYLIEECAENHRLQELSCNEKQHANMLWDTLLVSIEYIGQARALGTSIAAANHSTSVERIKLNYLQNYINTTLLVGAKDFDISLIQELINVINKQIIITKPSISAGDYFELATKAMDVLFSQFDKELEKLKQQVDS